MAEDPLRTAFEAIHAKFQQELEALRRALEAQQTSAVADARRQAEAAAESQWTARIEALRTETTVAATRTRDEHARALAAIQQQFDVARQEARQHAEAAGQADRDHARQLADMRAELAAMTGGREKAEAALKTERERAAGLDEARTQITALTTARDQALSALKTERERAAGLEEARAQITALTTARDQALSALKTERERAAGLEEARAQITALTTARDQALSALTTERERAAGLDQARAQISALTTARDQALSALKTERERATGLEEARTQISALTAARDQAESLLQAERERASSEIETARQRAVALEHAHDQMQAAFAAERDLALQKANALYERDTAAAVTEARAEERQAQLAIVERLLDAVKAIDASQTLSETLSALVGAVRPHAPRAAVFIVNRDQLQPWKAAGFENLGAQSLAAGEDGLLTRAVRSVEPVSTATLPAPAFATLATGRAALAVPIVVGGQAVAVLYADDGGAQESNAPASWPETVQILGRHASTCLAHLTASRTVQAAKFAVAPSGPAASAPTVAPPRPVPVAAPTVAATATATAPALSDEESSARRYARLLVSEIKLYNESAVRVGRERRDLLVRLGTEIARAQRLYEERVPPSIGARSQFFQQELVQTLADGDPGLLGGSASPR